MYDFHGGSLFQADIVLDFEFEAELRRTCKKGFPVFWMSDDLD